MAGLQGHQTLRLNLTPAVFPFWSQFDGMDIISAGEDENYNYIAQLGETVKDRGIPTVVYCHNVLPTAQGFQAVGYEVPQGSGNIPGAVFTHFSNAFGVTQLTQGNQTVIGLLANASTGAFDVYIMGYAAQLLKIGSISNSSTAYVGVLSTSAFIDNTYYTFISKIGAYQIGSNSVTAVTLSGLTITNVAGICAANGYMIAWDFNNNIAWSNATNPLDFNPSIATGAGGGSIQQVKGTISFCLPIAGGFLIYCSENVVSATYTGNSQFPFAFDEVENAGGIILGQAGTSTGYAGVPALNTGRVANQNNLGYHYAYTSAGLQQIGLQNAQIVFPELNEFLGKFIFEDFNETTNVLSTTYLTSPLDVKLAFIGNRYVIVSYGVVVGAYTHAIVFDTVLQRYGKLKINHVAFVEYDFHLYSNNTIPLGQENLPYRNIMCIDGSANINVLNMNIWQQTYEDHTGGQHSNSTPAQGVIILGKIQHSRQYWITHQWTQFECVYKANTLPPGSPGYPFVYISATNTWSISLLPTLDGKNFLAPVPMTTLIDNGYVKRAGLKYTCQNFSYLIKGTFNLTSLIVDFTQGGHR